MHLYYSDDYNATGVGFDTTRKADAIAQSLREEPIEGVEIVAPEPASIDELVEVHDRAYVDAVLTGEPWSLATSNGLPGGWGEDLADAVRASTGGVRAAALHALATGGIAGSLSSGLHHARRGQGNGYCTFNGLAIAALAALKAGARRVLVLDLDAHCGGATAELIESMDGVEQLDVSVVDFDGYSSRPDARLVMTNAPDYLATIEQELAGVADPGAIDLVLYNAGMDPHEDAGGVAGINAADLGDRDAMVFAWLRRHEVPSAFVLAGGYTISMEMAELVKLHRITIRCAAAAAQNGS